MLCSHCMAHSRRLSPNRIRTWQVWTPIILKRLRHSDSPRLDLEERERSSSSWASGIGTGSTSNVLLSRDPALNKALTKRTAVSTEQQGRYRQNLTPAAYTGQLTLGSLHCRPLLAPSRLSESQMVKRQALLASHFPIDEARASSASFLP